MPTVDIVVEVPIEPTFRVAQIKSMFDFNFERKLRREWKIDAPLDDKPWQIGMIVGPSGSGKSTVARELFGSAVIQARRWPRTRSILDGFAMGVETTKCVEWLSAVGLSSPPVWCKPFHVLSTGEQFRATIARALATAGPTDLVVCDEFTSVVDRVVAKTTSSAVAKAVRRTEQRFVAVACHYDIIEWLCPDWVLDMSRQAFIRRRLRRPDIKLELFGTCYARWSVYAPHHYLSSAMHKAANCYEVYWGPTPVAFVAMIASMGHRNVRRVHRLVVLPDYQGVGIGRAALRMVGEIEKAEGKRVTLTSSHPAMIKGLVRDEDWTAIGYAPVGYKNWRLRRKTERCGSRLATFEFRRGSR